MDSTFIAAAVQNVWNAWNIRGFVILSLCMQLILALAAPFRKKTSNAFVIFVVWSAYFLADWDAMFAFGLISNAGCRNSNNHKEVAQDIMAFWASFLLIHLGGPDTITAFSLEDNALWLRHVVGLIAQLFVFLYIFVRTLPHNKLLVPTMLIFVAGVIKYGERTRALYLASLENLKKSIKKTPNEDSEAHYPEEIRPAFHFQNLFKGLIVDILPDLSEWKVCREFILQKDANEVFRLISIEFSFWYEVFYTKIMAVSSGWGKSTHAIVYYCALAAFILFGLADKDEFHGVDVAITYALLVGVIVLDLASVVILGTSHLSEYNVFDKMMRAIKRWVFPSLICFALYDATKFLVRDSAIVRFMERKWSNKMGSFNLLSHCFKQSLPRKCRKPGFIWNKLAEMRHASKKDFNRDLWGFVFKDLKRKAAEPFNAERMRKVYEARGDWVIGESGCRELMRSISNFEYDHTLLIWHIAMEICYNIEGGIDDTDEMKKLSKILSDYMMYLLVKQPKLMSTVAGISHVRYENTCVHAKLLGRRSEAPDMLAFCRLILEGDINIAEPTTEVNHLEHSVLEDSRKLVLLIREKNNRWEIIFKVWMELLSYAAGHCRGDSHARLLGEGSEFITFVWMLMAHLGIGAQFPVE